MMPRWAISSARCIKTGNFCSYQPDPEFPIAWEFARDGLGYNHRAMRPAKRKWRSCSSAYRSSAELGRWCWTFAVLARGTNRIRGAGI